MRPGVELCKALRMYVRIYCIVYEYEEYCTLTWVDLLICIHTYVMNTHTGICTNMCTYMHVPTSIPTCCTKIVEYTYSRTSLVRTLLMSNTWLGSTYKDMIPQLITHNTNLYG